MLRRPLVVLASAAVLLLWAGNALALARAGKVPTAHEKKVVTETVLGTAERCHKWGTMQVRLEITKTVIAAGAKKPVVKIKIDAVDWPVYPDHTPKSKYINAQALPLLQGETLQLQADAGKKLENIAGATQTTVSWRLSLQAALAKALRPQ